MNKLMKMHDRIWCADDFFVFKEGVGGGGGKGGESRLFYVDFLFYHELVNEAESQRLELTV